MNERIVYNFHFYRPHRYTHQNTGKNKDQYTYPGWVGYRNWDKAALEKAVRTATDWAKENNAEYLFAGEFSVVQNAKGRNQYLADLLSIFEEKDISWAYFCFNGWKGWSYPFRSSNSKRKGKNETELETKKETEILLEKFWKKNLTESE